MNALMKTSDSPVTMTSLELVEFINSQREADEPELTHANFLAKVPKVLGETSHSFECDLPDVYGRARRGYRFPKREACLTGHELQLRPAGQGVRPHDCARKQARRQLSTCATRAQMAMAALQLIEVNQELQATIDQQQHKIAADAPKVEGFDRIASSDGSLCLTDTAKTLQVQPRKLTQLLQEKGWLYRRPMGSGWLAYQERIQQGLLEHKVTTGEKSDGSEWSSTQVRVTAKGLTKLADVVRQAGLH